jgi:hypothetical protein
MLGGGGGEGAVALSLSFNGLPDSCFFARIFVILHFQLVYFCLRVIPPPPPWHGKDHPPSHPGCRPLGSLITLPIPTPLSQLHPLFVPICSS